MRTSLVHPGLVFGVVVGLLAGCGRLGFGSLPPIDEPRGDTGVLTQDAGIPGFDATGAGGDSGVAETDGGMMDTGVMDAEAMDAGPMDAGLIDAGMVDTGTPDAASADRGLGLPDGDVDGGTLGAGPFPTPRLLEELSDPTGRSDDPTLPSDRLELFFESDRTGGLGNADLWVSVRSSTSDPWGSPAVVANVNTPQNENTPGISPDGLTLWFASDRPTGDETHDLYVSTRANRTGEWSTPTRVVELSSSGNDLAPAVDREELTLVFHSARTGGAGESDLYVSRRSDRASLWGPPTPLSELNTTARETAPILAGGGLYLFFGSSGINPSESDDLVLATRPTIADPFEVAVALDELNSSSSDFDAWVSEDLRHIVFASDRTGTFELYESSR